MIVYVVLMLDTLIANAYARHLPSLSYDIGSFIYCNHGR